MLARPRFSRWLEFRRTAPKERSFLLPCRNQLGLRQTERPRILSLPRHRSPPASPPSKIAHSAACFGSIRPGCVLGRVTSFYGDSRTASRLHRAQNSQKGLFWPEAQPALAAVVGAGAVLAATTQGPISAVVLIMELTGQDRSFIAPLLVAVVIATLVSRRIEPRSIYDARLTDEGIAQRQELREPARR